jgi:hypothetical protein
MTEGDIQPRGAIGLPTYLANTGPRVQYRSALSNPAGKCRSWASNGVIGPYILRIVRIASHSDDALIAFS